MLKPKQVPREAFLAMRDYAVERPYEFNFTEAIAAAINAWPGMEFQAGVYVGRPYDNIILPLNTETRDAEA